MDPQGLGCRQYGYSWREIAEHLHLTEPQTKLRFRYAIGKLRALFRRGGRDGLEGEQ